MQKNVKSHVFLDFQKNVKNVKKTCLDVGYIGLIPESLPKKMVTKLQQTCLICTLHIHAMTLDIVSVSYMENSAYSVNILFSFFLTCDQKNVKSHVFLDFQKKTKKTFSRTMVQFLFFIFHYILVAWLSG